MRTGSTLLSPTLAELPRSQSIARNITGQITGHMKASSKRFADDERGVVIILASMAIFILVFMAGMAVDYGRTTSLKSRMIHAVDAAALAVGREMLNGKLSDSELVDLGKKFFDENIKSNAPGPMARVASPQIVVNRDKGTVNIDVKGDIDMTLTKLGGFKNFVVPVKTESTFKQRDIEVGMALDVTGSMNLPPPGGGKAKLASLKSAFAEFANAIFPEEDNPQKVRVALVPYAKGVRLGKYANGNTTKTSPDGCVAERQGGSASDNTGKFHVVSDSPTDIDTFENNQGVLTCEQDVGGGKKVPQPVVTPLSDDKQALIDEVAAYTAGNGTAGHNGAQWAWNTISESWSGVFNGNSAPDPYSRVEDKKLLKAVVFMTDGVFNTAYHGKNSSSTQAIDICTAMKDKGVVVFSVGFGLGGNAKALSTLKSCSSPGNEYFANAENEDQLKQVFRSFANTLTALRLSK